MRKNYVGEFILFVLALRKIDKLREIYLSMFIYGKFMLTVFNVNFFLKQKNNFLFIKFFVYFDGEFQVKIVVKNFFSEVLHEIS